MIESYDFGTIKIDGKHYSSDVVIFQDHVNDHWWRKEGHRLNVEDLTGIVEAKPEAVIIGTGHSGLMKVPNEVRAYLASKGIQLIIENTHEACKTYNSLASTRKVIAALHLTC